jgi:hypothetical protein
MLQLNRSGNPDIRKAALLAAGKRVRFAETKEEEGESRDQNLSGTGTATGLNAFSGVIRDRAKFLLIFWIIFD